MIPRSALLAAAEIIQRAVEANGLCIWKVAVLCILPNGRRLFPGDLVVMRADHPDRPVVVEAALEPGDLVNLFARDPKALEPVTLSDDDGDGAPGSDSPDDGRHPSRQGERRQHADRRRRLLHLHEA